MASALPSNALYDVQKYLRQKRATGAQVTPQNERAAWSGYFDTMEQNSLAERRSAMEQERLNIFKDQQKAAEGAAEMSGVGQLVSTVGQGALLLKGTSLGSKVGLGTQPTATPAGQGTSSATAPFTASGGTSVGAGAAPFTSSGVPTTAAEMTAISGGETAAAVGAETGVLSAASPYLGPAGVGFAAGSMAPNVLGIKNEAARVGVGAVTGAASGALTGAALGGEIGTVAGPGYGTAIGAVIGAVAGGIGAKVK